MKEKADAAKDAGEAAARSMKVERDVVRRRDAAFQQAKSSAASSPPSAGPAAASPSVTSGSGISSPSAGGAVSPPAEPEVKPLVSVAISPTKFPGGEDAVLAELLEILALQAHYDDHQNAPLEMAGARFPGKRFAVDGKGMPLALARSMVRGMCGFPRDDDNGISVDSSRWLPLQGVKALKKVWGSDDGRKVLISALRAYGIAPKLLSEWRAALSLCQEDLNADVMKRSFYICGSPTARIMFGGDVKGIDVPECERFPIALSLWRVSGGDDKNPMIFSSAYRGSDFGQHAVNLPPTSQWREQAPHPEKHSSCGMWEPAMRSVVPALQFPLINSADVRDRVKSGTGFSLATLEMMSAEDLVALGLATMVYKQCVQKWVSLSAEGHNRDNFEEDDFYSVSEAGKLGGVFALEISKVLKGAGKWPVSGSFTKDCPAVGGGKAK